MLVKGNFLGTGVLEVTDRIQWLKLKGISGTSERPSGLVLQANASGTMTDWYIWVDSSNNLRMHTSEPTDEDANGSVIAGAANAGASKALDNLASTAVAADINLNDSVAVTFGTSQDYNIEYDGLDLKIDPAAANDRILIGGTTVSDIQITGAASEVTWDGSADTLTVMDSGILAFGDADDFTMTWNTTSMEFNAAAANGILNIGATVNTDVVFHGGTAGSDITWDASADDLIVSDDTHIAFGDGSDIYLNFDGIDLEMRQAVVGTGGFKIGVDDAGIDVTFFGDTAGDYIKWDASADMLIVEDASIRWDGANVTYDHQISTDSMLITATDHANAKYIFGTTGTNGLDVVFQGQASGDTVTFDAGAGTWTYADIQTVYTGADSSGTLLAITGIDTTGNSDTVTITHSGTGSGLKVTCSETDSVAATFLAKAAQTTSLVVFDGATADWSGADDVGMVHIKSDANLAHAGASLLYVTSSNIIDDAEGGLARFIDTAAAGGGTAEYAVEIASTNNEALHVSSGLAKFSGAVECAGTLAVTGAQTNTLGVQSAAVARTATVDGSGTGTIADGTSVVAVTCDDANKIIVLPTPTPGNIVWLIGDSTGYELRSSDPATVAINGGTGAGAESAVAGTDVLTRCVCATATTWIVTHFAADGTESAADAAV